ncbi:MULTISPECIES: hypothetical protein [unclassified Streptomyces]|uniref:hypothetical protein n=1 Tax=unclassified Streptomyces TaxID=2593676 RepID=UPI002252118D|nr:MULTISPECIES: hypothetical protein [unclassified Streptomyces]MCX5144052.1 hypothetical protein [Streptomyces sp. NBC_00338]WRZ68431.1 hypothetical protein OG408_33145 [Streptomyces sp. NBC_01257]WSU62388.1 hypothetical protein OG450_33110 [Streptomyces sp. NBC_01104]
MHVPEQVVYGLVLALVVLSPLIGFGRTKWLAVFTLLNIGEYRVLLGEDPFTMAVAVTALLGALLLLLEMTASHVMSGVLWMVCGVLVALAFANKEVTADWIVAARPWVAISTGVAAAVLAVRARRARLIAHDPSEGLRGM